MGSGRSSHSQQSYFTNSDNDGCSCDFHVIVAFGARARGVESWILCLGIRLRDGRRAHGLRHVLVTLGLASC